MGRKGVKNGEEVSKAPQSIVPSDPFDQCETMLEEFEDVVGDWYFHHQEQPLQHFLCEGHVLPAAETGKCVGLAPFLPDHNLPSPPGLIPTLFSIT